MRILILLLLFLFGKAEIPLLGRKNPRSTRKNDDKVLFKIKGGQYDGVVSHPHSAAMVMRNGHAMPVEECLRCLEVEESVGLTTSNAVARLDIYGKNLLAMTPKKSLLHLVMEQFDDRLVQILLGVAFLSSILAGFERDLHAFTEPLIILSILLLNACVGIWQKTSAEGAIDALKSLQPDFACVLRDGSWQNEFPVSDIVPGDIIYLRVGDKIPVDGRIIALKTTTFGTDESSLTGESVPTSKNVDVVDIDSKIDGKANMVFSGTMVTNGAAFVVATKTGTLTEIGIIDTGVQQAKQSEMKTPLAQKLDEFGQQMTYMIGGICTLVWLVNIPKFSSPVFTSKLQGAIYYAKVAVALGVAAIPEGLPAVITLCLSLGTHRMAKRNVIVRKLSAVETLGCTSVICTDKTGTLTTNQMVVKSMLTIGLASDGATVTLKERVVDGVSYDPRGDIEDFNEFNKNSHGIRRFAEICALCNEAEIVYKDGKYERVGEPTEAALRVLVEKIGVQDVIKSEEPSRLAKQSNDYWESRVEKLAVLEFSRDRKSMSVLCRPLYREFSNENPKGLMRNCLYIKGAAEVLVQRCSSVMLEDGTIVPLDSSLREVIREQLVALSRRPLRCLAMAYKCGSRLGELNQIKSTDDAMALELFKDVSKFIDIEQDLTLVGVCGIKDPARPEAADAILKCRQAGVRVMMITGDSKDTAVAIARDVNIFTPTEDVSDKAFTGQEFFSYSEADQLNFLKTANKVFCRTEPRDKQKLITMLERLNEIPAMTGDGVNDAPALQQAAIGIAMGITGTEVAKNAADMVLADDNFATIVAAVEEGRCIYNNMQSFICFLISSNIGEIVTILMATLLGLPEPLTPLHLLWVNLVTDGPPATALGFNPPDPDVMLKAPRPKNESILSPWLLFRYLITGSYVGFATVGIFIWWYLDKGITMTQLMNWNRCPEWTNFILSDAVLKQLDITTCDIFVLFRSKPQSLALSTLVAMEMLKALSAVSLDSSLLVLPPWKNGWLLLGVLLPCLLHLLVLYVSPLANVFGLSPLSWEDWKMVFKFAAPILLVEEILKFSRRIFLHRTSKPTPVAAMRSPI